ncbi:LysR family transcriptional regulator [Thalassotalea sp. M1531]|uniref:LysR family transcriptional regulator n=1 Tax=Thalassotalea algicola TaxID=2716224 RepID=A0A7Y0Q8R4_9GAMM|nr:LysR family transcriptional regulator [Thalassotalea algicola]NMP33182.1 LysR family transcriptional regulator [Thalassotalea algicola]
MNKLDAIKAFCLVCQEQSFTQVAKSMRLSPAMVGRYIRQLEEQLGTLLVKRTTRQMAITQAGKLYYQKVSPLLAELTLIEQELSSFSDMPKGQLKVSASIEFGGQYLAPIIAQYRQLYPNVELSFDLTNEPIDITQGAVDLVFRVAPTLANASLKVIPICTSKLAMWAHPKYLLQYPKITAIEDLANHQLLFFEHSLRSDQWIFLKNGEIQEVKLPWAWKTNNGRLLNEAAAQSQGIIQAPSYSVAGYVEQGLLVEVLSEHSIQPLTISAIYQHSYQYSLAIKTFVELAKNYFLLQPLP